MNLLSVFTTIVKSQSRNAAEQLADANSLQILDQRIHETETALLDAKRDLTRIVAQRFKLGREVEAMQSSIQQKEQQGKQALQASDTELAQDIALWIAERENILQQQRNNEQRLDDRISYLKLALEKVARKVEDYRREKVLLQGEITAGRATKKLQGKSSGLSDCLENIENAFVRVRRVQHDLADEISAVESLEDGLSDNRLEQRIQSLQPDRTEEIMQRFV